jgi:hypothetical protein
MLESFSQTMARTFVNVVVNEVFDQLNKCQLLEADRVLTNGCRCTPTAVFKDRWCVVVRHNGWPYFRPAALCNTHIHTQRQLPHRLYTTSSTARATGHVKRVSRYTAHEQPLVPCRATCNHNTIRETRPCNTHRDFRGSNRRPNTTVDTGQNTGNVDKKNPLSCAYSTCRTLRAALPLSFAKYKLCDQLHTFIGKKVISAQNLNSRRCKQQLKRSPPPPPFIPHES